MTDPPMSLDEAKVLVLILCFISALAGVMSAKWVEDYKVLLAYGRALAAGVLLAAGLVHMLPDACKQLCVDVKFPCANAVAGAAFVFLIFMEELASAVVKSDGHKTSSTGDSDSPSASSYTDGCCDSPAFSTASTETSSPQSPSPADLGKLHSNGSVGFSGKHQRSKNGALLEQVREGFVSMIGAGKRTKSDLQVGILGECAHCPDDESLESGDYINSAAHDVVEHGCNDHDHDYSRVGTMSHTRVAMLFAALGFHSVMEGMGLGVAQSHKQVLGIAIAILAHKALAAFALGSSLRQSKLPTYRFHTLALIFALGTPLGGILGKLMSEMIKGPVVGVCIALASGTFLQVATMEMIPSALQANYGSRLGRLSVLMLGFVVMSVLAFWC